MVSSIMSLLAPQAVQLDAGATSSGANTAALLPQVGAEPKQLTFDGFLAQQTAQALLDQQKSVANMLKVLSVNAEDGFPVDPALEETWLQTTGEEIVADVPEDIEAVDGSDVAMLSVIPPLTTTPALPEAKKEIMSLSEGGKDVAAVESALQLQEFVATQYDKGVLAHIADIPMKNSVLSEQSIQATNDNDSGRVVAYGGVMPTEVPQRNKELFQESFVTQPAHIAETDTPALPADSITQVQDKLLDTSVEVPEIMVAAHAMQQAIVTDETAGENAGDEGLFVASLPMDAATRKMLLAEGKTGGTSDDAMPINASASASDISVVEVDGNAATQEQKQQVIPEDSNHLRAALFRGHLEAMNRANPSSGGEDIALPVQGDGGDAAKTAELSLPLSQAETMDMQIGITKEQPMMATERHSSVLSGLHFQRDAPQHASVHEQIQVQIRQSTQDGEAGIIHVELRPIELGSIKISLEIAADNSTQVVVVAERQETLDMLQRDAKGLAKALSEAGLQADAGSLQFNMSGDGRSGGEAQAQKDAFGTDIERSNGKEGGQSDAEGMTQEKTSVKTDAYTVTTTQGIDIRV